MSQISSLKRIDQILPDFSKSGYPLEIFCTKQSVESLTCVICLGVYRDPITSTACGHTFCKPCFADLKAKSSLSTTCPDCRKIISSTIETFVIKSSILSQNVKCPLKILKKLPCEWEGKLDQLESHIEHDCKQAPRQKLKGYPPKIFVNTATKEALICQLCKGIFREPVVAVCGHTFCRNCLTQHEETSSANKEAGKKLCPTCFKEYSQFFPVLQVQKMIINEQVVCTVEVQKKPCAWRGTVEAWDVHRQKCTGILKDAKELAMLPEIAVEQRVNNEEEIIVQVNQSERQHPEVRNNQGQVSQVPVSRHRILDSCEGCCSAADKVMKFILLFLSRLLLDLVAFAIYVSTYGFLHAIRDPAIPMAIVLMVYSASCGWLIFFGLITPLALFLFIDFCRYFDFNELDFICTCNGPTSTTRAMDLITTKYICYSVTVSDDTRYSTAFASFTQQEKEKMANLWHHLYWWLMKSGIYIMTLVWTALIDESDTVSNYDTLILACRIVVGMNLGFDVLDYYLTFRRIRKLHRRYNI